MSPNISVSFNRYYTDLFINFIALIEKLKIDILNLNFEKDCICATTAYGIYAIIKPYNSNFDYTIKDNYSISIDPHVLLKLLVNFTKDYCLNIKITDQHLVITLSNDINTSEFTIKNLVTSDTIISNNVDDNDEEKYITLGSFFFISKLNVFKPNSLVSINTTSNTSNTNNKTLTITQVNEDIDIKIDINHNSEIDSEINNISINSNILALQYSAVTYLTYFTREVNISIKKDTIKMKYKLASLGEIYFTATMNFI